MYFEEIKGIGVLNKNANVVGKVEDIDFSLEDGVINGLVVSLKKNILSNDEVSVKFEDIAAIGDYVILKNDLPRPVKVESSDA